MTSSSMYIVVYDSIVVVVEMYWLPALLFQIGF